MKNPHFWNRLVYWFTHFGDVDEKINQTTVREYIESLNSRVIKLNRHHHASECDNSLSLVGICLAMAASYLQNKHLDYKGAQSFLASANNTLVQLAQKEQLGELRSCHRSHMFTQLYADIAKVSKNIDSLDEQPAESEFSTPLLA